MIWLLLSCSDNLLVHKGDGPEGTVMAECFDEIDNDNDGFIDCNDQDCLVYNECDANSLDTSTQVDTGESDTTCDATTDADIDGDGQSNCEDADIDGDGLANGVDGDPYDPSVVTPPTGGSGFDGDIDLGNQTFGTFTLLDGPHNNGVSSITVNDASVFSVDQEVLILNQQGTGAGAWETAFIGAINGNTLNIAPPLQNTYAATAVVLVQHIPHYENVIIPSGATLRATEWTGYGGGVIAFRASGNVTIDGFIDLQGSGYRGGESLYGNTTNPRQGESYTGLGALATPYANAGGGGSYPMREDHGDCGGGGGYGTTGTDGTDYFNTTVTSGGATYGDADLNTWFVGSGGGAGSPDDEDDGNSTANVSGGGGDGGGLLTIWSAGAVTINGTIYATGANGLNGIPIEGEVAGGGGGSGGQILLVGPSITINGTVSTNGGEGGKAYGHNGVYGDAVGGNGGDGRSKIQTDALSGTTSPPPGSITVWPPY